MSRANLKLGLGAASALLAALVAVLLVHWSPEPPNSGQSDELAVRSEPAPAHSPWQLLTEPTMDRPEPGSGFEQIEQDLVRPIAANLTAPAPGQQLELAIGPGQHERYTVVGQVQHDNGDISVHASGSGLTERATLTYGEQGLFARISSPDGLFLVHSDHSGSWLVDLNDDRLDVDPFHDDTLGQPALHPFAAQLTQTGRLSAAEHSESLMADLANAQTTQSLAQIDVMFIYTPDMLARYPGSLIETRLNHLVAIANQAMVDSQVPIVVRLVHHRSVNYTRNRNNRATLIELRNAMAGQTIPGFEGVSSARQQFGADIVALTWPHDIETRGSCGIAYFPVTGSSGPDPSYGVHIDNDGASNWSVCSDAVFTHELGHNLNAEHQRSQSSGDDPNRSNYAFIEPDRFHTVMGSFGTGHDNRYLRLDLFSNPRVQCGGAPCGSTQPGQGADNAAEIASFRFDVANYAASTVPGAVERPPPSNPDSDGDGVSDWDDPFPFDPWDGQPPDSGPGLVFSERALRDGSQPDDWELLIASAGSNSVLAFTTDGELLGTVARLEADDPAPVLTEYTDMAIDEAGRLYLLAYGDVRRYDRLSGEMIDIYLDATRPSPAELQSPFPRAMGFLPGAQLAVLGENAIERYNDQRQRLNFPQSSQLTSDPNHWNDLMELRFRAFAVRQFRFYLVEASSNRIMRFNTGSGFRMNDVVGPDNPWISDPWDLAFDTNGLLYLANGSAGNVLRFDPESNSFVDEFIAAGSQGLSFARAVAFGPDGDLYVACQASNRILRFDGQTGAPRGVVVEAGEAGLQQPSSLLFARRINEIHRGHSGHFFVPERAGEGWLFEVLDRERVSMSWFSYPPETGPDSGQAEQAWLVSVGQIDGNRVAFSEVLLTAGQGFGSAFDPGSLELIDWGEISLEFANCDSARLSYSGLEGWGEGSHRISRLITIPGLPCGSDALAASPDRPGISGQWHDPALSGQGWFLQEIEPDRVFVSWYSYDDAGRQVWVVGDSGRFEGRELIFDELLISRGTVFGEDFAAEDVELESWGRMRFSFSDCNLAVAEYESILPGFGSGILYPERLTRLEDLDCQLP